MTSDTNSLIDIDTLMARIREEIDNESDNPAQNNLSPYQSGTMLRFGEGGNIEPYLKNGWDHASDYYRWTLGKVSELSIPMISVDRTLLLSMYAHPLTGKQVHYQDVLVHWNERLVGEWRVKDRGFFHSLILNCKGSENPNSLSFHVPGATSPKSCGLSNDPRILGIGIHVLRIDAI